MPWSSNVKVAELTAAAVRYDTHHYEPAVQQPRQGQQRIFPCKSEVFRFHVGQNQIPLSRDITLALFLNQRQYFT